MNTVQKFESFYGTEVYHEYKNGYSYTDAIDYLEDQLQPTQFEKLLDTCISFMNAKYIFGFFELKVEKDKSYLEVDDGDGHKIARVVLPIAQNNCGLDEGTYKIWCQNYVIFGASEY